MKFEVRSETYFTAEELMDNYEVDMEELNPYYDEVKDKVFVEVKHIAPIFNFGENIEAEIIIKSRNGNPVIIIDEGL